MTPARVFVAGIGLLLFYLMFVRRGSGLSKFADYVTGELSSTATVIINMVRLVLGGYCAYVLTVMVLNLARIYTFGDIWLLLTSRPSRLGGSGLLGISVGIIFAGWSYRRIGNDSWSGFIRGRQLTDGPNAQSAKSLDRAAKVRDKNKQANQPK